MSVVCTCCLTYTAHTSVVSLFSSVKRTKVHTRYSDMGPMLHTKNYARTNPYDTVFLIQISTYEPIPTKTLIQVIKLIVIPTE